MGLFDRFKCYAPAQPCSRSRTSKISVDQQTREIVEYLTEREPQYVCQVKLMSNPLVRLVDILVLGSIGRLFIALGKRASGRKAIGFLSKAIAASSSKKVMAKALFYRANCLLDGAVDADRSIADYSLAIWCDHNDCWARKNRATIFEMYHASYGKGDRDFALPMTHAGACTDAEAAIDYFRSLAGSLPSPDGKEHAMRMVRECEEVLHKLKEDTLR